MTDPSERTDSDDKTSNGDSRKGDQRRHKPNREELVEISHDILQRIQIECDATGKPGVYYVLATHLLRDEGPYERFPIRANPKVPRIQQDDDEDEDDEGLEGGKGVKPLAKAFLLGMKQNQEFANMALSMIEGLVDRQDRALLRAEEALEQTRTQLLRQHDVVARAMDVNSERKIKENWEALKVKTVERGLNLFEGFAPQFMPGLLGGKNGGGIAESPESLTLKTFLRTVEDGGQLTEQQIDAVFGAFDDSPEMKLVRPGVLNEDQGKVIHQVAFLKAPAEELEKLIPGGELGLTQDQLVRLQGVFKDSMDQIAPIIGLFGMIMQKVQTRNAMKKEG